MIENKRCFVIMPFSKTNKHTREYWTDHFEKFLKPEIETNNPLIAFRSAPLKGDILKQIITDLVISPIVVCDITDFNPNVFWELGVRQSFKHCTITIAERGIKIPFDLGLKGTLFYYPNSHIKMAEFKKQFQSAIKECLVNPESPDSQVLETLGGRGSLFYILMKEEILRRLNAVVKEISNNMSTLETICRVCEINSEKRISGGDKNSFVTPSRFSLIAVESLIVNRYVNTTDDFYQSAYIYLDICYSCNQAASAASSQENRERVDNWFLRNKGEFKKICKCFKEQIMKQQQNISLRR
jgi:hypothetical protein